MYSESMTHEILTYHTKVIVNPINEIGVRSRSALGKTCMAIGMKLSLDNSATHNTPPPNDAAEVPQSMTRRTHYHPINSSVCV